MNTYKVRLLARKDTEINWDNDNPTLLNGEFGIATHDVNLVTEVKGIKIGEDKPWADTPYLPTGSSYGTDDAIADVMNAFGDTPSINFYYDGVDSKYKFEVIPDGHNHVTDITHAALLTKIAANGLMPSNFYKITDHATTHMIPYTNVSPSVAVINTAVLEPLIIQAITTNTLSIVAQSQLYPKDIIYYDVNDILCEDGVTARKGKIIYRKDTIKSIEAYYDWRNVIFRRWKIAPVAWLAGTTYGKWAVVLGSNGDTYISKKAGNYQNDPTLTPATGNAALAEYNVVYGPWWEKIVLGIKNQYLAYKPVTTAMASFNMPVNATDFQDFYTFNTATSPDYKNPLPLNKGNVGLYKEIKIGYHSTYNNIIFADNVEGGLNCYNNVFGERCADSLFFGVTIYNNKFGSRCSFNICGGSWYANTFGDNFSTNYSGYQNNKYWFGMTHNNIENDYYTNLHIADFNYNKVTGFLLSSNMWNSNCTRNTITGFFYNNVVGNDAADNNFQFSNGCNFDSNFKSNDCTGGGDLDRALVSSTFGTNCQANVIRSTSACTIGNNFQLNTILGTLKTLTIPDNFQSNKVFGIIAPNTVFAIGVNKNVFMNDFGGGTVAIPLNLISCVFNKPVSGLQVANTGVVLTGVVSNVSITSKTFPLSLNNEVISAISPDGSLWMYGTDNTGHVTTEKIV